ncbi:MAG: cytochrome P450 [Bacteroidota bacterium]
MATPIPGLRPVPILKGRVNLMRFFGDPIGVMTKIYREHGTIGAVTAKDSSMVCAFGPDYNQEILSNSRQYFNWADLPVEFPEGSPASRFGINLTAMNGGEHKRHRQMMQPPFLRSNIAGYRDAMVETIGEVLADWPEQGTINLKDEMVRISMLVMMRCMFGLRVKEEALALGQMSLDFLTQAVNPAVMAFPVNIPGTPYRKFLDFCGRFENKFIELIEARRASDVAPTDVLGMLIEAADDKGTRFTNEELVGQTGLLFVAGHETTAFTLIWTLTLLSQHPETYHKLQEELEPLQGEAPDNEKLRELSYLDAVIKESMRLLPATPNMFMRRGIDPFTLGGYDLPSGAKVILSPLITHRMPELYANPLSFRPERWETIKPSVYEYMPYGAGPRMCLGMGFADLEIRLALAMILQRWRVALPQGTTVDAKVRGITMGPKKGYTANLYPTAAEPAVNPIGGNLRELVSFPQ